MPCSPGFLYRKLGFFVSQLFVKSQLLAKKGDFLDNIRVTILFGHPSFHPEELIRDRSMNLYRDLSVFTGILLFCRSASADPRSRVPSAADSGERLPYASGVPFAITALSLLGRTAVRHRHSAYGGEFHLDQEFRLGRNAPWLAVVGGSVGEMLAPHEGRYWLYGANFALKRELGARHVHGLEAGASLDAEWLRPGHVEYGKMTPSYLGPYAAYTWEMNRLFFVAADVGVGFRLGSYDTGVPHTWITLGFGVNAVSFLRLPSSWGGFLFRG